VSGLFDGVYSTPQAQELTGSAAWLRAMLEVERALTVAAAQVGLAPRSAAEAVTAACRPESFDPDALAAGAATEATPVIALVARLRSLVGPEASPYVHLAATSQDILDSAGALVARSALGPVLDDCRVVSDTLAALARQHRGTAQVGRTLLQNALVTTFGAACANRLTGVDEALAGLEAVLRHRLAVQLGGPVGTLAGTADQAAPLVAAVAAELGLAEPVTPWHTTRGRVAELAAACGVLAGELAAVAQDVVLLSATEVAEVRVAAPGGSSAIPNKRNPAAAVLAVACAHRMPGLVATVLAGMPQELQRSAGRWQAEWGTLTEILRLLAATARHTRTALEGLQVDVDRMRAHVEALVATGADSGFGAAETFVDRALAAHETRTQARTPREGRT
jgi:3-carboxy-cis,cis-muconate cycloisomerase